MTFSCFSFPVFAFTTCVAFFEFESSVSSARTTIQTLSLSTSCNNLEDGLHYIKPTTEGDIIPVICNDGYTIINLALDFDGISSYFTSFYQTHWEENGVYSPDCVAGEGSSWRDWFIPATSTTKFEIAKDCMTCSSSLSYGSNTAYYLTNYYFCNNKHHSNACEYSDDELLTMDTLSYLVTDDSISMCNVCDDDKDIGQFDDNGNWLDCIALQLDADVETDDNHDNCQMRKALIVKPSVSNDGSYCTCYQTPDEDEQDEDAEAENEEKDNIITTHQVKINYFEQKELNVLLPKISTNVLEKYEKQGVYIDPLISLRTEADEDETSEETSDDDSEAGCSENSYYLSNEDFEDGTLRIKECGTYILTEDILIHFNKPNSNNLNDIDWSPNSYLYETDFPWYPTLEQEFLDDFEGLNTFHGTYQFGFFAGITIETDYVTIDLNTHSISMDYIYYLQQRVFTLIELSNKQFIMDQGPANLGKQEWITPSYITIKNGELGKTSHHSIHGNGASYVTISDVKIHNFDVTGIQCNGCDYFTISDTIIGPSNTDIPVLGKYTHGRALIPRLRYLVENYGEEIVTFGGGEHNINDDYSRTHTIEELADEFVQQMDLVYHYVINGIDWDEELKNEGQDKKHQWERAKELFINPTGYMDGGSSYGILLNGMGTGVVGFGRRKTGGRTNIIKNVEIFGIQNSPWERFWAKHKHKDIDTNSITGTTSQTVTSSSKIQGFFFDPLNWKSIIDKNNDYLYKGDAYHDLVFATQKIIQNGEFCLLSTLFTNPIIDWVFNNDLDKLEDVKFFCGSDVQSHDAKGTMGIRIDTVNGVSLENVYIHDIYNYGNLGDDSDYLCNNWDSIKFVENSYSSIEPGYTGTRSNGIIIDFATINNIENVLVENVKSKYGTATGISIYAGTKIEQGSDISIKNIHAGWGFQEQDRDKDLQDVNNLATQNRVPRACSIEKGQDEKNYAIEIDSDAFDETSMIGNNIVGYDICDAENGEVLGTMYSRNSNSNGNSNSKGMQADINVGVDHNNGASKINDNMSNIGVVSIIGAVICVLVGMILGAVCFYNYYNNNGLFSKNNCCYYNSKNKNSSRNKNKNKNNRNTLETECIETSPLLSRNKV